MMFKLWNTRNRLTSENELRLVESSLKVRLPKSYRSMLALVNGGNPNPNLIKAGGFIIKIEEFYGLDNKFSTLDLRIIDEINLIEIPVELMPIGRDILGNHIALGISKGNYGHIYWKDHEEIEPYNGLVKIAGSFDDLLAHLFFEKNEDDLFEIIAKSASVEDFSLSIKKYREVKNRWHRTLTQEVARHGRLDLLKVCFSYGSSLEDALHLAAMNGHLNVVRYLVEEVGIKASTKDSNGRTAAMCAFLNPDVQIYLESKTSEDDKGHFI